MNGGITSHYPLRPPDRAVGDVQGVNAALPVRDIHDGCGDGWRGGESSIDVIEPGFLAVAVVESDDATLFDVSLGADDDPIATHGWRCVRVHS